MSFAAIKWAMNQELPCTQKMVLVSLADFHNGKNGKCNPEKDSIASRAGISKRTADDTLAKLQSRGLIAIQSTGGRTSNQYVLNIHPDFQEPTVQELQGCDPSNHANPAPNPAAAAPLDPSNRANGARNRANGASNPAGAAPESGITSKEPITFAQNSFAHFWKCHPRKKDKGRARAAWEKLKLDDKPDLANRIIQDVEKRKTQDQQWQNIKFIPYPATYLNNERWEDDFESVTKQAPANSDPYSPAPPATDS